MKGFLRAAFIGAMAGALCSVTSADDGVQPDPGVALMERTTPPPPVVMWLRPSASAGRAFSQTFITPSHHLQHGNAALTYHRAIELASRLSNEDQAAILRVVSSPTERMDEALAVRICAQSRDVLQLAEHAARLDSCDWGTDLTVPGLALRAPELPLLRLLATIIALDARVAIMNHDAPRAIGAIGSGLALARSLGRGSSVLHASLGVWTASLMCDQLERWRSAPWDPPNLYWALTDLGAEPVSIETAVRVERSMLEVAAPSLRDIESEDADAASTLRAITSILSPGSAPAASSRTMTDRLADASEAAKNYPTARAFFAARGMTPERLDSIPVTELSARFVLVRALEWRDDMTKWLTLPYWQAGPGLTETFDRWHASRSSERLDAIEAMLPDLRVLARDAAAVNRRFAALRCAEALCFYAGAHDGSLPASLNEIASAPCPIDPVTGELFLYSVDDRFVAIVGPVPAFPAPRAPLRLEYRLLRGTPPSR